MTRNRSPPRRFIVQFIGWFLVIALFADTVTAANGLTLSQEPRKTLTVPRWLYLATGGATIGASALLASFVTDRVFVRHLHTWSWPVVQSARWHQPLIWLGRGLGVAILGLSIYLGTVGPQLPTANFAILIAFAGVRGALPMLTYLLGNGWPVLNPWRTLARAVPSGFRDYPASLHRWPAVAGLLALVWTEVVFPVSTVPSVLADVILLYSVLTLTGAVVFGPSSWFANADPLSVLFRFYGSMSPVQRESNALVVKLPGSDLRESSAVAHTSDVAFVVALVWELTYSGFITTEAGAGVIEGVVTTLPAGLAGETVRALLAYTLLFIGGYLVFLAGYQLASHLSRRVAGTYITPDSLAIQFAPPLIAIAAGYHLAHYVGLTVSLSPAMLSALTSPLSPPANPLVLSPPAWFDALSIGFVLLGHLVSIWIAHAVAFRLFPSRTVAIRSQVPFVGVMIGYTVLSLWILALPGAVPPYLG